MEAEEALSKGVLSQQVLEELLLMEFRLRYVIECVLFLPRNVQ